MPKVSVIIPTRNRVELLQRAITSVLCQTFDDFELLVVDDGSTDGTRDAVDARIDPRVRYLPQSESRGTAAARNVGITSAASPYCAFLDDDDEWLPDKLRLQIAKIEAASPRVAVIATGYVEVAATTRGVIREWIPTGTGWGFDEVLTRGNLAPTSTILVKTDCFARVGLFDPSLTYGEDLDMWLRLTREFDIDAVAAPLTIISLQPNGLSRSYAVIAQGCDAFIRKNRTVLEGFPQVYAERLRSLGTYYAFIGEMRKARTAFRQAVAVDPGNLKTYACIAASWMGSDMFKRLSTARILLLERAPQRIDSVSKRALSNRVSDSAQRGR
jgi:glycosyltransferase involved in cell wall biosynthesis